MTHVAVDKQCAHTHASPKHTCRRSNCSPSVISGSVFHCSLRLHNPPCSWHLLLTCWRKLGIMHLNMITEAGVTIIMCNNPLLLSLPLALSSLSLSLSPPLNGFWQLSPNFDEGLRWNNGMHTYRHRNTVIICRSVALSDVVADCYQLCVCVRAHTHTQALPHSFTYVKVEEFVPDCPCQWVHSWTNDQSMENNRWMWWAQRRRKMFVTTATTRSPPFNHHPVSITWPMTNGHCLLFKHQRHICIGD